MIDPADDDPLEQLTANHAARTELLATEARLLGFAKHGEELYESCILNANTSLRDSAEHRGFAANLMGIAQAIDRRIEAVQQRQRELLAQLEEEETDADRQSEAGLDEYYRQMPASEREAGERADREAESFVDHLLAGESIAWPTPPLH